MTYLNEPATDRPSIMNAFLRSLCIACLASTQMQAVPAVLNVNASQRSGTKLVDVFYGISGDGPFTVNMEVSADNGASFPILAVTVTGDAGPGVTAGNNKHLVWDAGADWDGKYTPECRVRVIASDGASQAVPTGMEYIPAGSIAGGACSAFLMDRYEVSKNLWDTVIAWSQTHGYSIGGGLASAATHPVVSVSWYDCVKWCNARSEREGLTPCYYTDATQTTIYRTGNMDVQNTWVIWTANGYRMPTELEWHWAASGGLGFAYPWGDTISAGDANFLGSEDPFESATIKTTPVGYYSGSQVPAGPNRANTFGLYDMSGNVGEWCWNAIYSGTSNGRITYPPGTSNPIGGTYNTGPGGNNWRTWHNASWGDAITSPNLRIYYVSGSVPSSTINGIGFRCARGL